jgi:peptide/nickel transport system substrate-binding protein
MKKVLIIILALVLISGVVLAGCSEKTTSTSTPKPTSSTPTQPASTPTAPSTTQPTATYTPPPTSTTPVSGTAQQGGNLRIIWSTGPGSGWGTCMAIFGGEGAYGDMAMEPLMESKFFGGFVPRLATSYTVSPDGKTLTFKLRQGVKFHDGTDFNAEAVKYNFTRYIEAGRSSANMLGAEVVDTYTVNINFAEAYNINFNEATAVMIASPTFIEQRGDTYAAFHACGTGPFMQTAYQEGTKVTFERFDDYWGQKAYLDSIECIFILDPVTQVMAMKAGEGDVTHSRDAKPMYDMQQAGFNILKNFMGMEAMNFNSRDEDSPFADARVRQAFEYAINKDPIINTLGYGFWETAYQFPIPGMSGYLEDAVPRKYDPEKAKALLAEAGYPNGFDTVLVHGVWDFNDGLLSMQADLAEVGINAEIEGVQFGQWATMRQEGWKGVFVAGSGMIPNFNSMLWSYFRPGNTEMYSIVRTPELTDLVLAAVRAIPADPALTNAAARYIYDQCLWAPIEHHGDNYAYVDKVHGLNFGTYGQWGAFDSEQVWISK